MFTRVFVDSDVVISSLLSSTGAAYLLLNQSQIKPVISSVSLKEIIAVAKRMDIDPQKFDKLIKGRFDIFNLTKKLGDIKKEYGKYVIDLQDAHVVAGAHGSAVKYLLSYNLKHFKTDKIRDDFDVLILTPALFLQFLRSQ